MMTSLDMYLQAIAQPHPPMGPRETRWRAWHEKNPHVYELFKRFSFEAIASGRKRSGAWLIVARIRWESAVVTRGCDFKISNDFTAWYARLFMEEFPEHRGFFVIKRMKPDVW